MTKAVPKFQASSCTACGAPIQVINGRWLALKREAAGVGLREFARRLAYSAAYLSDIEHGHRRCTPNILAGYENRL